VRWAIVAVATGGAIGSKAMQVACTPCGDLPSG
jgi:hypothetical protein